MEQRNFSAEKTAATATAATMQLHQGSGGCFCSYENESRPAAGRLSLSLSLLLRSLHCTCSSLQATAPSWYNHDERGKPRPLFLFLFLPHFRPWPKAGLRLVSASGRRQPAGEGGRSRAGPPGCNAMQPHCVAFACIAYIVLLYLGVSIGSGAREMRSAQAGRIPSTSSSARRPQSGECFSEGEQGLTFSPVETERRRAPG